MDEQIIKLAEETFGRYNALTGELSDPDIFSDQRRYREVAKEHARLRRGAELCQALLDAVAEMREARELVPTAETAEECARRPAGRTRRRRASGAPSSSPPGHRRCRAAPAHSPGSRPRPGPAAPPERPRPGGRRTRHRRRRRGPTP